MPKNVRKCPKIKIRTYSDILGHPGPAEGLSDIFRASAVIVSSRGRPKLAESFEKSRIGSLRAEQSQKASTPVLRPSFPLVLAGFDKIQSKPRKSSQNERKWRGADAFCDFSARNEPILDFSKDSTSLGRPLDDGICGWCPNMSESPSPEPGCPRMSEYVRILIFGHFRTFLGVFGQKKLLQITIFQIWLYRSPKPTHGAYFCRG